MSFIGFNLSNISDAKFGKIQVSEIYYGSQFIWGHDYSQDYLTFVALEPTTFSFTNTDNYIRYSLDDGTTWTSLDPNTSTPQLATGDKIIWKNGTTTITSPQYGIGTFTSTGRFKVCGNVMSLGYGDNFINYTSISNNQYKYLFKSNTNLVSIEYLVLPATTLGNSCYEGMFQGCTSLVVAPQLTATTLAQSCYQQMFRDCTSLTTAPELPATTLANFCYSNMFNGCTSLTTAPELPATTLANFCYAYMFYGCTSLNYIKCLATDITASDCTAYWVNNVAASGTFVRDAHTSWNIGVSGIPSGWTIDTYDYSLDYLTFEALEPTTFTFTENALQYSLDNGSTWITLTVNTASPQLVTGNKILWKQTGLTPDSTNGIGTFSATGNFKAYGNIMSLYYGDDFVGKANLTGKDYAFYQLFYQNANLTDAANLILPATTLSTYCYNNMFRSCTSLTTAPVLPATTLAESCYRSMFNSCTSLTTAPELPATILQRYCYGWMFENCTSLTTAPYLPALGHVGYAYNGMFRSCTSLNYIKCMLSPAGTSSNWVQNVASTGTFVKNPNTTNWTTGTSGIPSGWTVQNAS